MGDSPQDVRLSAPKGFAFEIIRASLMIRQAGIGMDTHRDGIDSELNRTAFAMLTAHMDKPSALFLKLLKSPNGDQVNGPS